MEYPQEWLWRFIDEHYNLEDFRTLCFSLEIDYDNLGGEGEDAKARELVEHLARHRRIPELIRVGRKMRPDVPWNARL